MSHDVTTKDDTSSNQAIKDPGQRWCGYSNLGKIVIKSVAAKRVAATFVAARDLAGKSGFAEMKRPSRSFAMQVAGHVTPRYSLVGGAYDHDCISFSRSVLQRVYLQMAVLAPICRISDTSCACYEIAREPPA
jgi:hypothetical protein